jgi:glycosyltransferase involved in cell wall biosynthesis
LAVVVVDDGSTDATGSIAAEKGALVVRHDRRRGLGRSFADGLDKALEEGPDIVVNIDADGQFDPADIPALVRPILAGEADFVTATRFGDPALLPDMPWIKRWGNRQMSRLVNFVTGSTRLTDVSCGFRACNLTAALQLHLSGHFTHTHETIIDLAVKGLRIAEVPLKVRGEREHGISRMAAFIPRYALRAGGMVLRTLCRTRPLFFFGGLGGVAMGLGVVQGLIVFIHWCVTGQTHPIQSLLLGSSLFITVGFLIFVLGFLADMLNRIISVSERLLFFHKLAQYIDVRDGRAHIDRTRAGLWPAEDAPAVGEDDL